MMDEKLESKLVEVAKRVSLNAYAPYSNYHVGAAVLTDEGAIFEGCNVENASYGLTMCAERVAIGAARAAGSSKFTAVAIYSPDAGAPFPCGACRQVMAEGNNRPLIIVIDRRGQRRRFPLEDLLPYTFKIEN